MLGGRLKHCPSATRRTGRLKKPGRVYREHAHGRVRAAAVFISVAALLLAHACATGPAVREEPDGPPAYRHLLLIVVHGDGAYLYHDGEGRAQRGDRTALERAKRVARDLETGEVFVFHQKPVHRVLSVPVGKESDLWWYRGGLLVDRVRYTRAGDPGSLFPELELLRTVRPSMDGRPSGTGRRGVDFAAFVYFGHQLPELESSGYHLSSPDASFTAGDVAWGAASFKQWMGEERLDLVVLSTCFGGTPGTVASLAPHTDYLVASPGSLHLSQMDIGHLGSLSRSRETGLEAFVLETAGRAFHTLAGITTTEVTVAVYETGLILDTLRLLLPAYQRTLRQAEESGGEELVEYYDCGEAPGLGWLRSSPGVTVFYRPPLFGRNAGKRSHSGWECLQVGPQPR